MFGITARLDSPKTLYVGKRLALALMMLCLLGVLAACDTAQPLGPPPPTPVVAWRPPTPFPPMEYPTDTSPPDASPDAVDDTLLGAGNASLKADELGKIQQELLQVELDTQKVRGLDPKTDVPERFVNRAQLRTRLLKERDTTYSREESRLNELELWLLRFVNKPSIGLYQLQADWLSEQLLGYYEPDKKELYVVNPQLPLDPQTKQTLSHEFVHNLQDQYYDLQKLLPTNSHDGDHDLAARSLIEGDAILSSVLYADQYMSHDDFQKLQGTIGSSPSLDSAPNVVREKLYFPYNKGLDFVKTLYSMGGFPAINNALAHPPTSSEQILHPQKYLSTPRDEPLPVGLPPLTNTLGLGWRYADSQTIGEFELGTLLQANGLASADASAAVTGWGGGQYDLYQNGANSLVMMVTRWDTGDDANRFYNALLQSLSKDRITGALWTDGSRYFNVLLRADRVIFVGGTSRNAVERSPSAVK